VIYDSPLDLVGGTPVMRLRNLVGPASAQLYGKLECWNPTGSSKDRAAKAMVAAAEAVGRLRPGGTIVESSSGNLGLALAMVARLRGYRFICVIDPHTPDVHRSMLTALGAEVRLVDAPDVHGNHLAARIQAAVRLEASIPGAFWPNQYANPANPQAYRTVALEIQADFGAALDWVVLPVGTGGLATGCSEAIKRLVPGVRVLAVDAAGSVTFGTPPGRRLLTGMGAAIVPPNCCPSLYDRVVHVTDDEAFAMTRALAHEEGLLLGGSSGAAVVAAVALAESLLPSQRVLVVLPDRGERYANTIFSDDWLAHHGIHLRPRQPGANVRG
jgi:N-(2-amino-2-carboxyethyl)-L-glutamate synthase